VFCVFHWHRATALQALGSAVLKWTLLAAFGFFAVLILERLA